MRNMTTKKLLFSLAIAMLFNYTVSGADVICKKDGGWYYPVNDKAIKITKYLKVKTCSGKSFHKFLSKHKLTTNAPMRGKTVSNEADFIKSLK